MLILKMLSDIEATIVAMTLQALITGVYLASFLLCMRWLVFSDDGGTQRKPINWPFLTITVIIFAFLLTSFGLSLQRALLFSQGASSHTLIYVENLNVRNPRIELCGVR